MLDMLAKDGYVAMKREAEDMWRCQRKSCQKPAAQKNTRERARENSMTIMYVTDGYVHCNTL